MKLALAGDTMLGRGVAEVLRERPPPHLVDPEVVAAAAEADLFLLNLECCISERGTRWPAPGKPFFFRAPPRAVDLLHYLGVGAVTLANNHALDYGVEALLDTFTHLDAAGIHCVGAGPDLAAARAPLTLTVGDERLGLIALGDHPEGFAARADTPGIAYAALEDGVPTWVVDAIGSLDADVRLVTPHWGPNMVQDPLDYVRAAARELVEAGATLVAGHSAHVFHGVARRVLYDLGDFLDDYAVDRRLRNDIGLLWLVDVRRDGPRRLEGLPLRLDYCYTGLARGEDYVWARRRFREACWALGTEPREQDGRLLVER